MRGENQLGHFVPTPPRICSRGKRDLWLYECKWLKFNHSGFKNILSGVTVAVNLRISLHYSACCFHLDCRVTSAVTSLYYRLPEKPWLITMRITSCIRNVWSFKVASNKAGRSAGFTVSHGGFWITKPNSPTNSADSIIFRPKHWIQDKRRSLLLM